MSFSDPDTPPSDLKRLKFGEVRADGKVFWGYQKGCRGGERWVLPEDFARRRSQQRKRIKSPEQKARDRILALNWSRRNQTRHVENGRRWRKLFPDKHRASVRRSRLKNADRYKESRRIAYRENPALAIAAVSKRRALKKGATTKDSNPLIIRSFFEVARRVGKCLGISHHVDHIVPLSRGGAHHQNNLQVLPARVNVRKQDKLPTEFSVNSFDTHGR